MNLVAILADGVIEAADAADAPRVVSGLPEGITQTQSYSWVLRELFVEALQPLFRGFTFVRNPERPIQTWQLPVVGVYMLPERMTPWGDINAGDIRFTHDFQVGFSIVIADNDHDKAQQTLDSYWWTLMFGLWANDGLTNLVMSNGPDNVRFMGVSLGNKRFVFGSVGQKNETPVAELQYEATCKFGSEWAPIPQDDLLTMRVTVLPGGFDQTVTPVITTEYDFSSTG